MHGMGECADFISVPYYTPKLSNMLGTQRTRAGLEAARARGRKGGRRFSLTKAQVRLAQAAMEKTETKVGELCSELGITRVTLYRYVGPRGELREYGRRVLES